MEYHVGVQYMELHPIKSRIKSLLVVNGQRSVVRQQGVGL